MNTIAKYSHQPWNKGKLVGQKAPLRVRDIWAISSIAALRACWLWRSNVRASAVAILQSELFGMTVVLE